MATSPLSIIQLLYLFHRWVEFGEKRAERICPIYYKKILVEKGGFQDFSLFPSKMYTFKFET